MRTRAYLSPRLVELPRSLQERFCIFLDLLHLGFTEKRLSAGVALGFYHDIQLREIKEIFTLATAATVCLFVHGRIHVNQDQTVV